MLDVIHLIVTVLSDLPSFRWACNVTGRPIWFRPLKSTFSTCFLAVVAQQWHGHDVVWGFGKRRLCAFYCGLTVLKLICSYITPRPQLSWKKPGNFSFDNMGPLICFSVFSRMFWVIVRKLLQGFYGVPVWGAVSMSLGFLG